MVYLDCDQVLADFIAGTARAINYPYPGTKNFPDGWTYNFFRFMNSTREEVDKHCDIDFWANLPWIEDGKEILKVVLSRFRPHEITVLTKPMRNNGSYTGKMIWFENNIPELYDRVILTFVPKEEFAFDWNHLLIDDCQENVERFIKAGGAAILVPRPWNQNRQVFFDGKAVKYITEMINGWIEIADHPTKRRNNV
jgi:hypothetical protein